jgi:uncharacterized protein
MLKSHLIAPFISLLMISLTLHSQEETPEVNPYKKLTKKFIGAVKRNEMNKILVYFDTTFYGKLIEAQTEKKINDFIKDEGAIVAIEKTEVDTQGCKMATCTSIRTAKGKYLWYHYYDQGQQIQKFEIDTFSQQWFYKPEALTNNNFSRKEVLFESNPYIKLPGSLYLPPKSAKKHSAAILVHGSGPHDRNVSIGKNKIFLDIAYKLVQQGIAVLIYDKRTYVYQYHDPFSMDSMDYYSETIDDAAAAFNFLKTQNEIDSTKIFIAGHSQGAMCAPLIAQKCKNLKGTILLAAPARPLLEIIPEQLDYVNKVDGNVTEEEEKMTSAIKWQVGNAMKPDLNLKSTTSLPFSVKPKYWLTDRNYKVLEEAKKINSPILLLQGARDYNVTIKDYDMWLKAMATKSNFKSYLFDDLDHSFFKGQGMAKPEDVMNVNHVSEKVTNKMIEFIKAN